MGTRITEIKNLKVFDQCVKNPVYIQWRGTNGGINYWLFHHVQTELLDTELNGEFAPYIDDLENATGTAVVMGKNATPGLIIGATVDAEDITQGVNPSLPPGLKGLIMSTDVKMLMNVETWATEGPKWMDVKVQPGSFKILETTSNKANIELTLVLPSIYTQQL